jgi:hypothetical protein
MSDIAVPAIRSPGYRNVRDIGTHTGIGVCFDSVSVCPYVKTVANLQPIPPVSRKMIIRQQVAGTLEDGHPILSVLE